MLFKMALKNIKKSVKDYAIYFFTLVIGVILFYIFNALETQTAFLTVSKSSYEILGLLTQSLSAVSVFVAIVLGGLIIYASRFLIKRRNKEFGVYLTLGMSKRKMSLILFYETLIVGIVSLGIGLFLGVLLSQFMSIIVANLFEADMSEFTFVFSKSAALKTCIYFGIAYVIVMIFNTIAIGKCKLIDLLYGAKKSERLKFHNPVLCLIVFLTAAVALGVAYYKVTAGFGDIGSGRELVAVIAVGAVSTFLLFWSLSGMMLSIFTKMKNMYFRKLNSFVLRQFSSKANTMVVSLSVICLMLFLTIVLLGTAASTIHSLNDNIRELLPCDMDMYKRFSEEDGYEGAVETVEAKGFDTSILKDQFKVNCYSTEELTMYDVVGDYIEPVVQSYMFIHKDNLEEIMKVSDYNKVADLFGNEHIVLDEDEYAVVSNFRMIVIARNKALKDGRIINLNGHTLKPAYDSCRECAVRMDGSKGNEGVIIVPDSVVSEDMLTGENFYANYARDKDAAEHYVLDFFEKNLPSDLHVIVKTKADIKTSSVGLIAIVTFICLYLGIIFLIASAAILSLKELTESADNVERYSVLRRIGTDERMINKALFKQIGMFFLFPMILAVIHSIFGLKASNIIFSVFGMSGLGSSMAAVAGIVLVIYGTYFLVTYVTSKHIIRG